MAVAFVLRLGPDETWREFVTRHARAEGLEDECLEVFDAEMAKGEEPEHAAFSALYEWDCAPIESLPLKPVRDEGDAQ